MKISARYLSCFAIACWICGCAGVSSRATLPADVDLAIFDGHWRLDAQASDDVRARLLPKFEENEKRWRRKAERFDDQSPQEDRHGDSKGEGHGEKRGESRDANREDGISNLRWLQRERQKDVQTLLAMLMPATQLDIEHIDRSLRIATDKGEGTRVITPGEESALFLPAGGFKVTSGWDHGGLLIESRGTGDNKLRILDRYTLRDGKLEERMEVKIPNIGKQSFLFIYLR